MKIKVPYLVTKPGANGTRYFWQPSTDLRKLGWKSERLRNADGSPATTLDEAVALAKARNEQLDAWRKGGQAPAVDVPAPAPVQEVQPGSVAHIIRLYKASPRFVTRAEKTRYEYGLNLEIIEQWAGKAPVKAITRELVQQYYQALWDTGKHAKANAVLRVLRLLLKFAWDNGFTTHNAAEKPGMITLQPRLRIWSEAEIDTFVAAADAAGWPSVGDAVVWGCYLGQRQGDLLKLLEIQVQPDVAGRLRVRRRQNKTGAYIDIPLHPRLKARYEAAQERRRSLGVTAPTILWNEATRKAWNADTFRHTFTEIRSVAAQLVPSLAAGAVIGPLPADTWPQGAPPADAWFMDTRDTAVTMLAEAGCTVPEICAITGHDEDSAYKILKHYMALNGAMADAAIGKLLAYEEQKRAKAGSDH